MPSSPHSALLITPSIIHHLSYHIQKLCPCHKGYSQSLNPVLQNSSKGKGETSRMNNCQVFIFILCSCLWFNSSYPYTGHDSPGSIYFFFLYIPYHRGAEQHLAGWDGVLRSCSALSCTHKSGWCLRRGKALCHTEPSSSSSEWLWWAQQALCQGVFMCTVIFQQSTLEAFIKPNIKEWVTSRSPKTVTYKW